MGPNEKRILAVDDNATILKIIRFVLGKKGYDVTLARNGREALKLLRTQDFDLVLTDYEMPKMDGETLCRQMRHMERLKDVPVIMLSGKGLAVKRDRLLEGLDVCEILIKPFSPATLVATVEACLGEEKEQQEDEKEATAV